MVPKEGVKPFCNKPIGDSINFCAMTLCCCSIRYEIQIYELRNLGSLAQLLTLFGIFTFMRSMAESEENKYQKKKKISLHVKITRCEMIWSQ